MYTLDAERKDEALGPAGGPQILPLMRLTRRALVFCLVALAAWPRVAVPAQDPPSSAGPGPTAGVAVSDEPSPLGPSFRSMTGDDLFSKLLEHNQLRDAHLRGYSALRDYSVTNDKGKVYAEEVVRVTYSAPDRKNFVVESANGSGLVRDLVLKRLMESESETSSGRAHRASAVQPENYDLTPIGEQDVGPYHCLVVRITPKRRDKYLFEGRLWIDSEDYGIVRMAGRPAKALSFWITQADFVRQYQKIGEFWLPARDETFVRIRLYGKRILTIGHRDYTVNGGDPR